MNRRPQVVEAYLTHSRTPLITEVLKNGRVRKVSRRQYGGADGWTRELAELLAIYGERWTGVRELAKVSQ